MTGEEGQKPQHSSEQHGDSGKRKNLWCDLGQRSDATKMFQTGNVSVAQTQNKVTD